MLPSLASIASRLKFRQLSLLVALEECGSLHKASQRLAMTQPGLTKALQEIESTFGTALFVRTPHGVQPNEMGRCITRYARLMHADLGNLREEMDGVLRGSGGRLAVGCITGALHSVLMGALARLRQLQPAILVHVRESISIELLNQVNQGTLDLALCRTSVSSHPEHFDYEPLLDEDVAIAVGMHHPLAQAPQVTLEQLVESHWVLYPGSMPLRHLLERELAQAGLSLACHPIETASSLATMLLLKQDPQAVALMATGTMAFCEEHQIARRLPLTLQARHEGFGIATRRGARLSPAATLLAECLRTAAQAAKAC